MPAEISTTDIHDEVTALLLPAVFRLALEQEIGRANRHQRGLSVLLFRIDKLTELTAAHGADAGERLVDRIGFFARRFFRRHDWVARRAADSITVLLTEAAPDIAATLAERFRETISQRLVLTDFSTNAETRISLRAAVVATEVVRGNLEAEDVLQELETAVRRAGADGGNRIEQVALFPTAVTIPAAATLLGRTPQDVAELVRDGSLRATRRGRQFYIERELLGELPQKL
jgi:diguanylate cyclase (GGDEF)-like protein